MGHLEDALCHALDLREELYETPSQGFDLGYGGHVEGWPHVPRSALVPKAKANRTKWLDRLTVALDLVDIGVNNEKGNPSLYWRAYRTGIADVSRRLRAAFLDDIFGPNETVTTDTLASMAAHLKITPRRTNPEEILAVAMEDIGFASLGTRRTLRGVERVEFEDAEVVVQLAEKKPLRLARHRKFGGPRTVKGDQLLHEHVPGFASYLNRAQRETVHELCDPNGASVVISHLATGGGKSLCYFLAAAHARKERLPHTAVVVSPIVALQNDQVLRVTNKLNAQLRASLNVGQINMTVPLEEREEIYGKLFRGELHVLFLSPEKLIEPFFRETLLALAERQKIGFLVIDEAHIVPEWGRDFRTHFHRLGVIREELHERCPSLRTLILSATLTDTSERRVLEVLRIDPDECHRITDAHIRREISVRVERFDSREERIERLLEIAPYLPEPTIVYCRRRDNARRILKRLKQAGCFRCCDYTGSTSAEARPGRLQAFHRGDVSFVIGTNAFGLGIDKQDVRSIVHFDVPDNLDTCYQEIGRAARDRQTGHSFIFYSPRGMGEATRRSRSIITSEKAWDRAKAILRGRQPKKRGCPVLLPIHVVPSYMRQDGKGDSELNREWNLATLNILERQGVVDVRGAVYRHVKLTRTTRRARKSQAADDAKELIQQLLGRRKAIKVDLVKAARERRLPLQELHAKLIAARQLRVVDLEPLDEELGEFWVLAMLNERGTWSPEHMELLEEIRDQELEESSIGLEALRRFLKAKGCRLKHFAELYGFPIPNPCGHCDRCLAALRHR